MTEQNKIDDPTDVLALSAEESAKLIEWIRGAFFSEGVRRVYNSTSYGLKHSYEAETGTYVHNGAFKGAMMLCGFFPTNPLDKNATYKIKPTRKLKIGP